MRSVPGARAGRGRLDRGSVGLVLNWRLFGRGPKVDIVTPMSVRLATFGLARAPSDLVLSCAEPVAPFDGDTLFFDVFHTGDDEIVCLGPSLEGVGPGELDLRFTAIGGDGPIAVRYEPPRLIEQPVGRFVLRAPGLRRLRIAAGGEQVEVPPRPPSAAMLAGHRVIMTLSRNNPLPWIEDWASFHVARQGATAVLLYDNGSTEYGLEDIARTLSRVAGLRRAIVVHWPFPYGVGGTSETPSRDNFCQTGMLDHARRHFCPQASSVLNLDVDELLPRRGKGIFEQIESGRFAAIHFQGLWVECDGIGERSQALAVRHRDCVHAWRSQLETIAAGRRDGLCRPKWAAVPARCGPDTDWGVHQVYAATEEAKATQASWRSTDASLHYRHFRQINAGWKTDRWKSSQPFDAVCAPDRRLSREMARWTSRGPKTR